MQEKRVQQPAEERMAAEKKAWLALLDQLNKLVPSTVFNKLVFPDQDAPVKLSDPQITRRLFGKISAAFIGGVVLGKYIVGKENKDPSLDFRSSFENASRNPEIFFRYVLEQIAIDMFLRRVENPPNWHSFDGDVIALDGRTEAVYPKGEIGSHFSVIFNYANFQMKEIRFKNDRNNQPILRVSTNMGEGSSGYFREKFFDEFSDAVSLLTSEDNELSNSVITFEQKSLIPFPESKSSRFQIFLEVLQKFNFSWKSGKPLLTVDSIMKVPVVVTDSDLQKRSAQVVGNLHRDREDAIYRLYEVQTLMHARVDISKQQAYADPSKNYSWIIMPATSLFGDSRIIENAYSSVADFFYQPDAMAKVWQLTPQAFPDFSLLEQEIFNALTESESTTNIVDSNDYSSQPAQLRGPSA